MLQYLKKTFTEIHSTTTTSPPDRDCALRCSLLLPSHLCSGDFFLSEAHIGVITKSYGKYTLQEPQSYYKSLQV